tara:strand:- start:267 stop:551 length:285 start_codon:yes stop_codon:yes gene_type:complete
MNLTNYQRKNRKLELNLKLIGGGNSMVNDKEISKILHRKRIEGKTSGMWLYHGIPTMKRIGKWNDLYQWEKEWFDSKVGIRWDKKGNLIKQTND